MSFRITYSVLEADLTELHRSFDQVLSEVKSRLGRTHPSYIQGQAFDEGQSFEKRNPACANELLGRFATVPLSKLDDIFESAKRAQKNWGLKPWQERVALMRKAADIISRRRLEIASILSLEVGKNRLESLGDAEEAADLLRYYASQVEEAQGFEKPLARLSPQEDTKSVLKPYGVFVVISPFNFPMALAAGMASAALLGGNSVILKPSPDAPWSARLFYECLNEAGLPQGLLQLVYSEKPEMGEALVRHPKTNGVAFTGSLNIGMKILSSLNTIYPKPTLMEMGGKNPAIVCESADLDKAAEGCVRSAFGLSGQKCSALSRLYVHKKIKNELLGKIIEKTRALKIGDPTLKENFMGPVINERALMRHMEAVNLARKEGKILFGGEDIRNIKGLESGFFVQPTIAEIPRESRLLKDELFTPFLAVREFEKLEDALREANDVIYGLTAGIFSQDSREIDEFMENIQAGVLYSNRQTGATTGAWPGVQAFSGWKGSGSTGKGGCGPYYASQFMREQSQTRMS